MGQGHRHCEACTTPVAEEVVGRGVMVARAVGRGAQWGAYIGGAVGLFGLIGGLFVVATVFFGAIVGAVFGGMVGTVAGLLFAALRPWIAARPTRADWVGMLAAPLTVAAVVLLARAGWETLGSGEVTLGLVGAAAGAGLASRVVLAEPAECGYCGAPPFAGSGGDGEARGARYFVPEPPMTSSRRRWGTPA